MIIHAVKKFNIHIPHRFSLFLLLIQALKSRLEFEFVEGPYEVPRTSVIYRT
jgi:hypothetical protein